MKRLIKPCFLSAILSTLLGSSPVVMAQQSIANPLIRPPMATERPAAAATASAADSVGKSEDAAELRRQAERRITQEDLNIRQQELNAPVIPTPLLTMFSNMQVTAHIQGAVVMRQVENETRLVAVAAPAAPQPGAQAGGATTSVASRPVSRSQTALRLKVGQTVNVSGYPLRAKVAGQDVSVDWLSDSGRWVNVFFGALESSHGGLAQVPSDSQLLEVDTKAFDYLVPELTTQTFSSSGMNGSGNQNNGGFGSSFGGGNNNNNNQNSFGTGF